MAKIILSITTDAKLLRGLIMSAIFCQSTSCTGSSFSPKQKNVLFTFFISTASNQDCGSTYPIASVLFHRIHQSHRDNPQQPPRTRHFVKSSKVQSSSIFPFQRRRPPLSWGIGARQIPQRCKFCHLALRRLRPSVSSALGLWIPTDLSWGHNARRNSNVSIHCCLPGRKFFHLQEIF